MVRYFGRVALVAAALAFTACPDQASNGQATPPPAAVTPDAGAAPAVVAPVVIDAGAPAAAESADAGIAADAGTAAVTPPASTEKKPAAAQQYATFETTLGKIVVRLFPEDAPKTVQNFVELAEGKKDWTDPRTNKVTRARLYDGTLFHRVIPDFMIQGGDPLGQGVGGPGYQFEDEFQSGRGFDKPGLLAMANRGPNTNGSQFFITTSTPSHLNNRHTIFGEVVEGYEVVLKISNVQTSARNKPAQDVVIKKVVISSKRP